MAENKQEKQRPEVAVAREYFTLTYQAWSLNHNGYKFGMTDTQINEALADLQPHIAKSMAEGLERFVDPQQKNHSEKNRNLGFSQWYRGWGDFFYGMEKEEYDKFAQSERQYHEQGTCPEYENTQCPKQFKKQIPDLTEKQWATIGDDMDKLRAVLKNKENRVKLSTLETWEKKHYKEAKKTNNTDVLNEFSDVYGIS